MQPNVSPTPLGWPQKQGLYDPQFERDACGVGFVVNIKGQKSHQIIQQGLEVLNNLTHGGATGAEPNTGDGAGILFQSMIFTIDRIMEQGSWLDYGMFLENIMVAARARGLDTCPQAAFTQFHRVIKDVLGVPDEQMSSAACRSGMPT